MKIHFSYKREDYTGIVVTVNKIAKAIRHKSSFRQLCNITKRLRTLTTQILLFHSHLPIDVCLSADLMYYAKQENTLLQFSSAR